MARGIVNPKTPGYAQAVTDELVVLPTVVRDGWSLTTLAHAFDADARDWLVLCEPGAEPVAALSPTIGALRPMAVCTRSWCVRPVSGVSARRVKPST